MDMKEMEDEGLLIKSSADNLQRFVESGRFAHYIGMISPPRPGVMECILTLKYTHFKPGTLRENLFFIHIIRWNCIFWIMASVPTEDKYLMENFAGQCGLSIKSGTPTSTADGRDVGFPVSNDNVFTFGNVPDHPVFRGDPEIIRSMLESEIELLEIIAGKSNKDNLLN